MKRVLVFLVTSVLLSFAFMQITVRFWNQAVSGKQDQSPQVKFRRVERAIPDRYIVVFNEDSLGIKDSVSQPGDKTTDQSPDLVRQRDAIMGKKVEAKAIELVRVHRGVITHIYKSAIKGFSAQMSEVEAMALSENPEVKYVEEDGLSSIDTIQTNATWGIDRIDQHDIPLNSTYTHYQTGAGVNAYVLDTGIMISHSEFGNRATVGFDAIDDDNNSSTSSNADRNGRDGLDCHGHGTHVAGTIGGSAFGVAKDLRLHSVRVLGRQSNGSLGNGCGIFGRNSEIIAGINWVRDNHVKPAVANMSFGGPGSTAMDDAVRSLISAGVTCVIAAGNGDTNAGGQSPARVTEAITVGATTITDTRAIFSNFGPVLDVFAPGVDILSAGIASNTATAFLSGTSQAAPHVAGVAAMYLQSHKAALPSAVGSAIANKASRDKVVDPGTGSQNRLLYSHGVGELYTTDGLGNLSFLKEYEWRESWDLIIPGNFNGDNLPDLLFYDRTSGEAEFHRTNGSGEVIQMGDTLVWGSGYDLIIPGNFGNFVNGVADNWTDLVFYSKSAGLGEVYATDGQGHVRRLGDVKEWGSGYDLIIPGNFGNFVNGVADNWTDLVFYSKSAGLGEIYATDGQGNIRRLGDLQEWGPNYDLIVPGNFGDYIVRIGDNWTDLVFYNKSAGLGEVYATDGHGHVRRLGGVKEWGSGYDLIIPGNFGGNGRTDLLYYSRAVGLGEIYATDGAGNLSLLRSHSWRNSWDLIIPSNFVGASWAGPLFYQR